MTPRHIVSERKGDTVYTPDWVAKDMVSHFQPVGRVLEPARGRGVFMSYLPPDADWCEITDGRDFFDWQTSVDWVVTNPPYSLTRKWFQHSFTVAEHLLYLVPLRNVFSGFGFVREIYDFGGIAEIRMYGTGSTLGFPMGNAIGAFHISRNFLGPTKFSFAKQPMKERSERSRRSRDEFKDASPEECEGGGLLGGGEGVAGPNRLELFGMPSLCQDDDT